jgi:hypothetical protein
VAGRSSVGHTGVPYFSVMTARYWWSVAHTYSIHQRQAKLNVTSRQQKIVQTNHFYHFQPVRSCIVLIRSSGHIRHARQPTTEIWANLVRAVMG